MCYDVGQGPRYPKMSELLPHPAADMIYWGEKDSSCPPPAGGLQARTGRTAKWICARRAMRVDTHGDEIAEQQPFLSIGGIRASDVDAASTGGINWQRRTGSRVRSALTGALKKA